MYLLRTGTPRLLLIGLVAAFALAGCGGDRQPEASPQSLDTSTPTTGTGAPPPETSSSGKSVSLPSAPVGGQSIQPGDDPTFQCLSVNWLAGDDAEIPAGATVTLGDFTFDPAVFDVAAGGCDFDGPHCVGYTFTSTDQSCSLPVQWNGTPFDADLFEASADVTATASCADASTACTDFLDAVVHQDPAQLGLVLPPIDTTTTDGSETEDGAETTTGG